MNYRMRTIALKTLQRVPVWSAALGTLLCVLLSMECDVLSEWCRAIFEVTVITSGFAIVDVFSKYLRLCMVQRMGMYYTYMLFVCLWVIRFDDAMDEKIHVMHLVMMTLGIAYVMMVLYLRYGLPNGRNKKGR